MMKLAWRSALGMAAIMVAGCGDDSGTANQCMVTPPTTWSAPDWAGNTAPALALRGQIDVLVSRMRAAEDGSMPLTGGVGDLTTLYEGGDPSVADIASTAFGPVVDEALMEFAELEASGDQDLVDNGAWTPGDNGGIFGTESRGLHEGGLEVRQIVDKGLFAGGALYAYAAQLTAGTITPATIDALAAAWGGNSELDPEGDLTDSANYANRMGYHAEISEALRSAKAYAADEQCGTQRDTAIRQFFALWEEAMFARFTFYVNAAAAIIIDGAADDDAYADAFHELAEGIGLGFGFLGLQNPSTGPLSAGVKVATDAQIQTMLTALGVNASDLGAATTGSIVVDSADFQTARDAVNQSVQTVFGLTTAELQSWIEPTEG